MEKFILIVEEIKFNGINWQIYGDELENIVYRSYKEAKNEFEKLILKYDEQSQELKKTYLVQLICNEDDFDKRNKNRLIGKDFK